MSLPLASRSRAPGRKQPRIAARAILLLVLVLRPPGLVGAQTLAYDHTTFLNGFASDSGIWTLGYRDLGWLTPPAYLKSTVDLRTVGMPNLHEDSTYLGDVGLLGRYLAPGGKHVLVGHSLGGLVARGTYIRRGDLRPAYAGIITIAPPHQGALLADSSFRVEQLLADTQRRVNGGVSAVQMEVWVATLFLSTVSPSYQGLYFKIATKLHRTLDQNRLSIDNFLGIAQSPSLPDLRTTSAAIAELNANTTDAAVPRANLKGTIPVRNAVLRLKQSAERADEKYDETVRGRNIGLSVFKACRAVGYGTIVLSLQARKCGWAIKVMERIDNKWAGFAKGFRTITPYGIQLRVPVEGAFDGVVPNARSVYPGLTDLSADLPAIDLTNHFNIYNTRRGLDQLATAMFKVGMQRPAPVSTAGPLAATISGPNPVKSGYYQTYSANTAGGTTPYRYQWSGLLSGTGSSVRAMMTTSGTLKLDVWDAAGQHVSTSIYIDVILQR